MPAANHGSAQHLIELASSRANRIYVAGPMTGYPEFNFPAFNTVAATMRAEGWHVENPADHGIVDGAEWADYLRYDVGRLATCEAIMLLPGWSKSKGANLEVIIARQLDMPIMLAEGAESAEQPHAEPIAWMVGTAIWWTKEEAERDAAATGLPMISVGPMVNAGELARLNNATAFVQRLVDCAGTQPSVATGYLRDILDELKGNAKPTAPVERDERAAFEHHHRICDLVRDEDCPEEYRNQSVQDSWEGWQARASLVRMPSLNTRSTFVLQT